MAIDPSVRRCESWKKKKEHSNCAGIRVRGQFDTIRSKSQLSLTQEKGSKSKVFDEPSPGEKRATWYQVRPMPSIAVKTEDKMAMPISPTVSEVHQHATFPIYKPHERPTDQLDSAHPPEYYKPHLDREQYDAMYAQSLQDPGTFWQKVLIRFSCMWRFLILRLRWPPRWIGSSPLAQ